MTGYILVAFLYLFAGYALSLEIGFRVSRGEAGHILLCMLVWPIVCLLAVAWVIEDVITYLQRKR